MFTPKKNDSLRALIDAPAVYSQPSLNAPRAQYNQPFEARFGIRDFHKGEVIGAATGEVRINAGQRFIEFNQTLYTIGGWPFYPLNREDHLGYLPDDTLNIEWEDSVGIIEGDGSNQSKEDFLLELDSKYYTSWGPQVPHANDISLKKNTKGNMEWYLTWPNRYGQFITTFDQLSLAAKLENTGALSAGGTTGGPGGATLTTAGTTTGTTAKTSGLSKQTMLIGGVLIALFVGIVVYTLRRKKTPAAPVTPSPSTR